MTVSAYLEQLGGGQWVLVLGAFLIAGWLVDSVPQIGYPFLVLLILATLIAWSERGFKL